MTQRNPMNERYTTDKQLGKTRKSAASAKPTVARASTVRDPAPKTKRQKKAEQQARERRIAEKRGMPQNASESKLLYEVPTAEYKKWRRIWWASIIGAFVFAIPSVIVTTMRLPVRFMYLLIILSWVCLIFALYVDLGRLRKIRKKYQQDVVMGKSKEARAQQKQHAAQYREQRKAEEEARKKALAEGKDPNPKKGPLIDIKTLFRRKKGTSEDSEAADDANAESIKTAK